MRLAGAIAVVWLVVHPARAQDIWSAAVDPRAARTAALAEAVERMLYRADESFPSLSLQRQFTLGALALLEASGGTTSTDPKLQFLYGRALASPWARQPHAAISALSLAMESSPASPFVGEALYHLGVSAACAGDLERAGLAFRRALQGLWQPALRAQALLESGETSLARGDVRAAVAAFEEAAQMAPNKRLRGIAYYGLGATLDRAGMPRQALEAAGIALAIRLPTRYYGAADVLDLPALGCDLLPGERVFRRALANTAGALTEASDDRRQELLDTAAAGWSSYLDVQGIDSMSRRRAAWRLQQAKKALLDLELRQGNDEVAPATRSPAAQ